MLPISTSGWIRQLATDVACNHPNRLTHLGTWTPIGDIAQLLVHNIAQGPGAGNNRHPPAAQRQTCNLYKTDYTTTREYYSEQMRRHTWNNAVNRQWQTKPRHGPACARQPWHLMFRG